MKAKSIIPLLFLFVISLLAGSCKSTRNASEKPLKEREVHAFGQKNAELLLQKLNTRNIDTNWISFKSNINFRAGDDVKKFKASFRIHTDSAIWVSLVPFAGLEVARIIITEDSLKYIDRINAEYYAGDFSAINERLKTEFDFDVLQEMIIGNSIGVEENENLKISSDQKQFLLSGYKKRKLNKKKGPYKEKDILKEKLDKVDSVVHSIWVDKDSYFITRQMVQDFENQRTLSGIYSNFMFEDSWRFPGIISFEIRSEMIFTATMENSRLELGIPKSLSFKVPSRYERISNL